MGDEEDTSLLGIARDAISRVAGATESVAEAVWDGQVEAVEAVGDGVVRGAAFVAGAVGATDTAATLDEVDNALYGDINQRQWDAENEAERALNDITDTDAWHPF